MTGADCDEDVISAIEKHVTAHGYGEKTALRIVLVGRINASYAPSTVRIAANPRLDSLALLQVKNKTAGDLGLEYLERDLTIRGEIYRSLLPLLRSADPAEREKASLALRFALNSLDKRELGVD